MEENVYNIVDDGSEKAERTESSVTDILSWWAGKSC